VDDRIADPDSSASPTTCQYAVAGPIAAIDSVISKVPPIRNGRAPYRSTRKPIGVCINAAAADITAITRPNSANDTPNACFQAMNSGGKQSW
jgi:hypothetical protein